MKKLFLKIHEILIGIFSRVVNLRKLCGRYIEGKSGLINAYKNSTPISTQEKEEIENFWKPFVVDLKERISFDIRWFEVFKKVNVFGYNLKYYIPDGYYYCIVDDFFSDVERAAVLDDKNLYDLYFYDVNRPKTIARKVNDIFLDGEYKIINEDEVVARCVNNCAVIIKPAIDAVAGHGILYWNKDNNSEDKLRKMLRTESFLVIQEVIQQHSTLAKLNDSCVNTLRMVTLHWKGAVVLTTAVVIIGGKNSKTNHLHSGGVVCGILPDGKLQHTAFDRNLTQYETYSDGMNFSDVVIPNYDKCVGLVKKLATRLCRVSKLTAWDITIDKNGEPMLVEVNLTYGGSVQIAGGPVFGDMTEEVLNYISKERNGIH